MDHKFPDESLSNSLEQPLDGSPDKPYDESSDESSDKSYHAGDTSPSYPSDDTEPTDIRESEAYINVSSEKERRRLIKKQKKIDAGLSRCGIVREALSLKTRSQEFSDAALLKTERGISQKREVRMGVNGVTMTKGYWNSRGSMKTISNLSWSCTGGDISISRARELSITKRMK